MNPAQDISTTMGFVFLISVDLESVRRAPGILNFVALLDE
jgi:hypothetical protein